MQVFDGADWSDPDLVYIRVNAVPVAIATPNTITVKPGEEFRLEGINSYDPDNGPDPLTYLWQSADVSLKTPTESRTGAKAPKTPGEYRVTLAVFDGLQWSRRDLVKVKVAE